MIQVGSYVNIIDNSGAQTAMCIRLLNSGYKQRYAYSGSFILVTIKSVLPLINIKVKKGELYKALLVHTKKTKRNFSKDYVNYFENTAVLYTKQNKLVGTRIFGTIPNSFRYSKFLKTISISTGVIEDN